MPLATQSHALSTFDARSYSRCAASTLLGCHFVYANVGSGRSRLTVQIPRARDSGDLGICDRRIRSLITGFPIFFAEGVCESCRNWVSADAPVLATQLCGCVNRYAHLAPAHLPVLATQLCGCVNSRPMRPSRFFPVLATQLCGCVNAPLSASGCAYLY